MIPARPFYTFVLLASASAAPISVPGGPDVHLTRNVHTDAYEMRGNEVPARDVTQHVWMRGKDQLRIEEGNRVTIVRRDEKKIHLLDLAEKTVATVEMPVDLTRYLPEEMRDRAQKMADRMSATADVKPTQETKAFGAFTAKKFQVEWTGGRGAAGTEEIWASEDVGVDVKALRELQAEVASLRMGGSAGAAAMSKIEGVPVFVKRTRPRMGGAEVTTTEELVSVERKEAPAGAFDVPADFKAIEFNPFDGRGIGGGRGFGNRREGAESRPRGGRGEGAGSRPSSRPRREE